MAAKAVLFVDDSPLARARAGRLLVEQGLAVTALSSVEEAAAVDARSLAAALLDLELGDGFGTDVAARLRKDAPCLPIAFLTASGPSALRDAAALMGPVFSKTSDVENAVRWVARAAGVPAP